MTRLRVLKLGGGHFTDKGLLVLKGLTALRSLGLQNCIKVTDKGLKDVVLPLSKHFLASVDMEFCSGLTHLSSVSQMQDLTASTV